MSSKSELKNTRKNDKNKRLRKTKPDPESDSESSVLFSDTEESIYETASETDSTYTPPKNTKKKNAKNIVVESSDDYADDDEDETEFDRKGFRKTLAKLFPSKYMSKKVKKDEKDEKEDEKPNKKKSSSKHSKKTSKKTKSASKKSSKKSKKEESDESESSEESEDEDDENSSDDESNDDASDSEESNDGEHTSRKKVGKNAVNIVFSIGGGRGLGDDEEYDEDYDYEDEDELEDSEEDECNSDDEAAFMKETYEKLEMPKEIEPVKQSSKTTKSSKQSKPEEETVKERSKPAKEDDIEEVDVQIEYAELQELRKQLTEKLHKKPNSKILRNAITECKNSIRELVKTSRSKNTKSYYKLIHKDRKKTNELDYFKKNMSNKEQLRIMNEMKEINNHIYIEKPYRLALLQANIPARFKAIAMQKLNALKMMEPGDSEYYKIKNWVDTFMKVPFNVHKSLSVNISNGIEACHSFMGNAKDILDNCVYGLDDAKMQIMQMIGQWISNPSAMGTAIAIKGPPGTGKTSLVKEGISKILGREFAFIALGGAGDSSFLEGHSYTYEGSSWGRIVQILVDSKCMNPVIYFDELDKISDTPRGEEIVGILTHLTDTSQNCEFHDKYFSEISFDLSKCLFIFSYNDESRVNPILKDRMYRIQTKGYEAKEKVTIARNYMLPKIREQVGFAEGDVIIPDDVIQYIASSQSLTNGESGVRNLKRCLEIIHTKLNLFRLMKPGDNIFMKDINIEVSFPFTVTRQLVDKFVKSDEPQNQSFLAMYT
jgi:ATP-dependent Lon protease